MEFGLLGGLEVTLDGRRVELGGPKQRAVLAVLVLEAGRTTSADRLVDLVWGASPPARAEASLQSYVSNLRRLLEPARPARQEASVLVTRGGGYALAVDPDQVDLHRVVTLAEQGAGQLERGEAAAAASTLDVALEAMRRPLLPELADEPWVAAADVSLRATRAEALEHRVEASLALGRPGEAVRFAEEAVALDPYRERARARLALALYRDGRQRDALAALADARRLLADDIGIDPGPELRALEQAVLAQSPELDGPPPSGSPPARTDRGEEGRPTEDRPTEGGPSPAAGDRVFVGRRRELRALVDALEASRTGGGRPVVVSGEPGIGKTRLVEELAARSGDQLVLWARCPESAAQAAYWPLVQIARQMTEVGATGEALDALLLATSHSDPEADPMSRHVAVAEALARLDVPVTVVLDDLQWADSGTLRLLEFVAGELRHTHLLVVATVRPTGPDSPTVLVDCLAELVRQPGSLRIDLSGLAASEVREWLERRDERVGDGIAELVHDRTGGNAFFVGEVVELLAAEDRLSDVARASRGATVPAAVHDVVRRRVGRLPGPTQQLLSTASVVGRTFDLDLLAAVAGVDPLDALDGLDPALEAGLIDEHDRPGCFQFTHALVADALTDELSPARRARIHAATARCTARLRGTGSDDDVAAMAHHAYAGAAAGTAEEAYEWSVRAAGLAAGRLAHLDAAGHWLRAADAVRMARPLDVRARYEALLEAGRALVRVDSVVAGYAALVEALELGLSAGDPDMIGPAAAAMHLEGLWPAGDIEMVEVDAVGVLTRAVAALPSDPSPERVLALGSLAECGYYVLAPGEIDQLTTEALDDARALADPVLLARALGKRIQTMWQAVHLAERQEAGAELDRLLTAADLPPDVRAASIYSVASVKWDEGDIDAARAGVAEARALAARHSGPAVISQLEFFQASLHHHAGAVGEGLACVDAAHDLHRRTRGFGADGIAAAYATVFQVELDDLEGVRAGEVLAMASPFAPLFQEFVALAYTMLGRLDLADALLRELPPIADGWIFLGVTVAAAHNRAALGRTDEARIFHGHLAPYSGRMAAPGTGPILGDVDLALARVERLLGDQGAADRHLDRSIETLGRTGSVPWSVRARLLRHEWHGDPADLAEAARLVDGRDLRRLGAEVTRRQAGSK